MAPSRELPHDRQAIGQLLVRLLREFRLDLAAPRAEAGYGDIRDPHMPVSYTHLTLPTNREV